MSVRNDPRPNIIMVNKDWGSPVLWMRGRDSGFGPLASYAFLDLPRWLLDRFEFWSEWHDSWVPETPCPEPESDAWDSYGMSLASDLKRVVGDRFAVYYGTEVEIGLRGPLSVSRLGRPAYVWRRQLSYDQMQKVDSLELMRQRFLPSGLVERCRFARCQLRDTTNWWNVSHTAEGTWEGRPVN